MIVKSTSDTPANLSQSLRILRRQREVCKSANSKPRFQKGLVAGINAIDLHCLRRISATDNISLLLLPLNNSSGQQ